MNLQQTVSTILNREVSKEEAMEFANAQFGTLAAYLRKDYIKSEDIILVTELINNTPSTPRLFTSIEDAERCFIQCVRENTDIGMNDEYYESFLEDGAFYARSGYICTICSPTIEVK